MPDPFPTIKAVRVRGAGASHEGPRREQNEDACGFFEDEAAAIAIVADGMGGRSSGRRAADMTVETCAQMFRGRTATVLDELAEVWWLGEHGTDKHAGPRPRPFSALPIADRVELRARVRLLIERRVPDSMGDVAVLEAELQSLLAIPERALARANGAIYRLAERDVTARGHGAAVVCAIFAAGRASIAHVGDSRVSMVRGDSIEALTQEHTLQNDYMNFPPEQRQLSAEEIEHLPRNVITRALGMSDTVKVDTRVVELQTGDKFLLSSDGLWQAFSDKELLGAMRTHGAGAAAYLVERGRLDRRDHPGDNLTAVVVEII